MLTTRYR